MVVLTLNLFRKLFQLINSFSSKDWQFQYAKKVFVESLVMSRKTLIRVGLTRN